MTGTSRVTTTATLTTSGGLTAGDLRSFLREAPDEATIRITEDRDRNVSSTTVTATWTPTSKPAASCGHIHQGNGVCRTPSFRGEEMGG